MSEVTNLTFRTAEAVSLYGTGSRLVHWTVCSAGVNSVPSGSLIISSLSVYRTVTDFSLDLGMRQYIEEFRLTPKVHPSDTPFVLKFADFGVQHVLRGAFDTLLNSLSLLPRQLHDVLGFFNCKGDHES